MNIRTEVNPFIIPVKSVTSVKKVKINLLPNLTRWVKLNLVREKQINKSFRVNGKLDYWA